MPQGMSQCAFATVDGRSQLVRRDMRTPRLSCRGRWPGDLAAGVGTGGRGRSAKCRSVSGACQTWREKGDRGLPSDSNPDAAGQVPRGNDFTTGRALVSRFVSRWPFADRLGEDLVRGLDADERRGPGVPVGDEGGDRSDEFADAPEAAPPDGLAAENAEPRLDLVHPGCRGRREVEGDPRVALQPGPDRRRLVG